MKYFALIDDRIVRFYILVTFRGRFLLSTFSEPPRVSGTQFPVLSSRCSMLGAQCPVLSVQCSVQWWRLSVMVAVRTFLLDVLEQIGLPAKMFISEGW